MNASHFYLVPWDLAVEFSVSNPNGRNKSEMLCSLLPFSTFGSDDYLLPPSVLEGTERALGVFFRKINPKKYPNPHPAN